MRTHPRPRPRPVLATAALLTLASLVFAPPARAQDGPVREKAVLVQDALPGDPMGVTIHRLANGMTVMLSENHTTPRIEGWITVRAGSAKDPADATGMAHYLEHMQFKGSNRIGTLDWEKEKPHLDRIRALYDQLFGTTDPAKRAELYAEIDAENQKASAFAVPSEIDRTYDAFGFRGLNAFTNSDQTSYTVNLSRNRIREWAEIEAERLRAPVYRLFQSELEAVYEEKNKGRDERPRVMYEALSLALFPAHPYGTQGTIGHAEHLKNPSLTKMYEFFDRWYRPANLVVALSGDFDRAATLAILEQTLGTLPARDVPPDPVFPIIRRPGVTRVETRFKGEEEVAVAWVTVKSGHPDELPLVLADMMLANGETGLVDVNVNQAQRTRSANASHSLMIDAGTEVMSASPKPGQSLEECEKILLAEMDNLKAGKFTEDDMAAVVTDFELSQKRQLESNRARVQVMTGTYVMRTPWEEQVHRIDRLRKVTKADVVAAANKWFGPDYVVLVRRNAVPNVPVIPKPRFTKVDIDASRRSSYAAELLARKADPIEPKFVVAGADVHEVALKSGTLYYAPNPLNDVFDLTFVVPVGTDHVPSLATAFPLLDLGGAGDLDGTALKRKLYAIGSSISAGAGREESVISVSGLESNLEATIDLLRRHFETPTGVGQADLDKLVQRTLGMRKDQKDLPQGVAAALNEFALRGPDSAFLVAPSNEDLAKYKAEDLLAATRDVWKYKRIVRYVGQLPKERIASLVDVPPIGAGIEAMAEGHAHKAFRPALAPKNRILFVEQPAAQAQVRIVAEDGTFVREEVPLQRVYNEYMSGSMGSVVFQEIRESESLAYTAGTTYRAPDWKQDANIMLGAMATQPDKTLRAVEKLLGIVRTMPSAQSRFDNAVRAIDQTYRSTPLEFRQVPGQFFAWKRQGLDGDPRPYNWDRIQKMKLADLEAFAARFKEKPFTVTIVGPRAKTAADGTVTPGVDLEKLAAFGEIVEMKADQLFRW